MKQKTKKRRTNARLNLVCFLQEFFFFFHFLFYEFLFKIWLMFTLKVAENEGKKRIKKKFISQFERKRWQIAHNEQINQKQKGTASVVLSSHVIVIDCVWINEIEW